MRYYQVQLPKITYTNPERASGKRHKYHDNAALKMNENGLTIAIIFKNLLPESVTT
jgi:hypothetical protein